MLCCRPAARMHVLLQPRLWGPALAPGQQPAPQTSPLTLTLPRRLPCLSQVVPGVAIAFMTYELAKKTLGVTTNATER